MVAASRNHEKSIRLFSAQLAPSVGGQPRSQEMESEIRDVLLFLDLDLSILGSDRVTYQQYAEGIRKEYHMFSEKDFRAKRIDFLKTMLSSEAVKFPVLGAAFSRQAAENIEEEIAREI